MLGMSLALGGFGMGKYIRFLFAMYVCIQSESSIGFKHKSPSEGSLITQNLMNEMRQEQKHANQDSLARTRKCAKIFFTSRLYSWSTNGQYAIAVLTNDQMQRLSYGIIRNPRNGQVEFMCDLHHPLLDIARGSRPYYVGKSATLRGTCLWRDANYKYHPVGVYSDYKIIQFIEEGGELLLLYKERKGPNSQYGNVAIEQRFVKIDPPDGASRLPLSTMRSSY